MASITKKINRNGTAYRIEFFSGRRRFIRLPSNYNERTANDLKHVVERLLYALENDLLPDKKTASMLESFPEEIIEKLEAVELLGKRKKCRLGDIWESFLSVSNGRKDSTIITYQTAKKRFFDVFRVNESVNDITPERAFLWREKLGKYLSKASVFSTVTRVKTVFNWAVKMDYIFENPFERLEKGVSVNKSREFFVSMDVYYRLLAACPCPQWRALLALCRVGGLRNPSETLLLKWQDVDFQAGRLWVSSPKTEKRPGLEGRSIPLFPQLKEELERLAAERQPGETGEAFVISELKADRASLRNSLIKIIKLAGVQQWPRLFHNLRGSRSNEIYREFPLPVASYWLGHSPRTALTYYLHPLESDYQRAIVAGKVAGKQGKTGEN